MGPNVEWPFLGSTIYVPRFIYGSPTATSGSKRGSDTIRNGLSSNWKLFSRAQICYILTWWCQNPKVLPFLGRVLENWWLTLANDDWTFWWLIMALISIGSPVVLQSNVPPFMADASEHSTWWSGGLGNPLCGIMFLDPGVAFYGQDR